MTGVEDSMDPLVSVIVPTRDAAATLGRCLQSLLAQDYPNIEIIVVDNHSQDKTQEIAKHFGVRLIVAGSERSEQTNIGAKNASGEYFYRTDADFVFDPWLISHCVNLALSGHDAVIVHGTSDPTISLWAKVRKAERDSFEGDWAHTAASFFSREAFNSVGGFNELLTAFEDYDLTNRFLRAGYKVGRIKARAYHLGEPKTLAEIVRKYIYYGNKKNLLVFASENPGKGLWQISPIRLVYLKNLRKFGLYFLPFLLYHYVKYVSAIIGFVSS
jgi:glycosyltransferase involved in cell wall biosynthesis